MNMEGFSAILPIPWQISNSKNRKKTKRAESGGLGASPMGSAQVGVGGLAGRLGGEAGLQGHAGPKSRPAQARGSSHRALAQVGVGGEAERGAGPGGAVNASAPLARSMQTRQRPRQGTTGVAGTGISSAVVKDGGRRRRDSADPGRIWRETTARVDSGQSMGIHGVCLL